MSMCPDIEQTNKIKNMFGKYLYIQPICTWLKNEIYRSSNFIRVNEFFIFILRMYDKFRRLMRIRNDFGWFDWIKVFIQNIFREMQYHLPTKKQD